MRSSEPGPELNHLGSIESMNKWCLLLCLWLCHSQVLAEKPAQVMLFGTFHFQDAGLDVVKSEDVNVMAEAPQLYLQELAERLAAWGPTEVLLEYDPAEDEMINQRYQDYLDGKFQLPANEIYQLGFRVARLAGLKRVHSFDNRDIEWQAQAMFDYAKAHDSPEMNTFNEIIEAFTAEDTQARASLPLGDLLKRANDPQQDRLNMDLYIATNSIGAGDGFVGADAAASWWQRNFRMYAKVQKLAGPGKRTLVLGGAGHIAILRQFLGIDRRLQGSDIRDYL